jgi:hypothetical protein
MFSLIRDYQLSAGSSDSIVAFINWINTTRNSLDKPTQVALDDLSNAAYLLFKGKTAFAIDRVAKDLFKQDYNTNYTSSSGKQLTYPTTLTVTGGTLPSDALIKAQLAKFDAVVKENSQLAKSKINVLQTLS